MFTLMNDERARNADRIDAGKWLADRGFGKSPLVVSAGVTPEHLLHDYFMKFSREDLEAMTLARESPMPARGPTTLRREPTARRAAELSSTARPPPW